MFLVIGSSDIGTLLGSSSDVPLDLHIIQFWCVVSTWLVSRLTRPELDNISDGIGSFVELFAYWWYLFGFNQGVGS